MVVLMLWLNCAAVLAGLVIGGFGVPWLAVPAGCTVALLAVLLSSTRRLLRALLPPLLVVAMAIYGTPAHRPDSRKHQQRHQPPRPLKLPSTGWWTYAASWPVPTRTPLAHPPARCWPPW